MRSTNSGSHLWPAAILLICLLFAALVAIMWGKMAWALGMAVGGNLLAFLWLAIGAKTSGGRLQKSRSLARVRPTRRHRLIAQLRDVRDAVDSLPDAVVLMDHQGRVSWFNAAATRLLGVQQHHTGHALSEQLAGSKLGTWLLTDMRQPATDMPSPADDSLRLGVTIMPFGSHFRLLQARDISTLSRLEQVRRDFVANVSHELRTPLTVIHGYLEVLDPADAPALAPVLGEMRLQSQRMGQIVEDLLTLSRLETREALPDEEVAMPALLETLRREASALSQGRHVITIDATTQANLRGSIHDLHSAFSNLVSNAVRYTPTGGAIIIGWRQTADGGAVFWVRDSGLGISAEHLIRLTERFYRVSSSRSRESGGTGLGLSIVKHILNLHQARLQVESEPGRGSTFTCILEASRVLQPGDGDLIGFDDSAR